jgi:2,3-bisphosphoglycerate-independent phosphoglycerate mutase
MNDTVKKKIVLVTINGWGVSSDVDNNAIRKAKIEDFKDLVGSYPSSSIVLSSDKISENYRIMGLGTKNSNSLNNNSLASILEDHNLNQIKIADSENFPLVSVFFNNSESILNNEEWIIVEEEEKVIDKFLSIDERITKKVVSSIKSLKYDFIFANLSEIGKSVKKGDFNRIISSVERTSLSLKKIVKAALEDDFTVVVLGAYGSAEDSFNVNTKIPNTSKTSNPVPILIIDNAYRGRSIGLEEAPNNDLSLISPQGDFTDITPTILNIMGIDIPSTVEGESFI